MTRIDLTNVKTGDSLAIRLTSRGSDLSHRLLIVDRLTDTQVICRDARGQFGEVRFRKSDGKQIGEEYRYAELGTPELIASVQHQAEQVQRRQLARDALSDLEGKHLHQLKLSIEQLEALAKAWREIKAMQLAA